MLDGCVQMCLVFNSTYLGWGAALAELQSQLEPGRLNFALGLLFFPFGGFDLFGFFLEWPGACELL